MKQRLETGLKKAGKRSYFDQRNGRNLLVILNSAEGEGLDLYSQI
jgi:hypothetical protein